MEGTEKADKLDVLLALVEIYEAKRWPIKTDESFDPIDVLNYAIEELGHSQAELAELFGSRSRASEILSRRRLRPAVFRQFVRDATFGREDACGEPTCRLSCFRYA